MKKEIKDKLEKKYKFISELTDHGNSFVYLIESKEDQSKFILRIGKKDLSLKNNIVALKILSKENNVPKVVSLGKIKEYFYSIETFVPGNKREKSVSNLKKLIAGVKIIHSYKSKRGGWLSTPQIKWKRYFIENYVNSYQSRFSKKIKNFKKYIKFAKENIPDEKEFSLLHGDFSFTNSLFSKNKVYFFDFEDSFYGPKEYDLSMIYYMEFLPKVDIIELIKIKNYDLRKVLYYALCIGIRKVALAKGNKHTKQRLRRLEIIYKHLKNM